MAKRRFKIETLSREELQELQNIASIHAGGYENLLDYLEEKGKLPDDVVNYFQQGGEGSKVALSRIESIVSKLPNQNEAFKRFIEKTKDESVLTQEELQDRLTALQGIEPIPQANIQQIKDEIKTAFFLRGGDETHISNFLTFEDAERISRELASYIVNEAVSPQDIANRASVLLGQSGVIKTGKGRELEKNTIPNAISDILNAGQRYIDFREGGERREEDIKRVQDLLSARKEVDVREQEIEDYLSGLPEELRRTREEFLTGEEKRAEEELERQVPFILQDLNVRGMLFSGEVSDALTSRALSLGSSLESIRAELEEEDNQFYYDAAYKNALRKNLESVEDYRSVLGEERQRILTGREQKFRSYQSLLDRILDEELRKSEYQRDLALKRQEFARQRDLERSQSRRELFSRLGQTAGTIGGTYLGQRSFSQPETSSTQIPSKIG